MGRKLFIFDTADEDNFDQAVVRFKPHEVEWIGANGEDELLAGLDKLVRKQATFDRVLVQTHGEPGVLKFGKYDLWSWILQRDYAPRAYYKLFPVFTKFYFDGCNVGAGGRGDSFLTAVGETFFRLGGGQASAWTSPGYVYGWLPFVGSHTYHWTGDLKTMTFMPATGKAIRVA
jgi:hypothetical protein